MDLQGVFVKSGDFIKFKGFLVEFLENRRSWENQKTPENRQKSGLFWASPFTMHLVLTLLIKVKLALPPPPFQKTTQPPSKTTNLMGMGGFRQKGPKKIPRAHEIGTAISSLAFAICCACVLKTLRFKALRFIGIIERGAPQAYVRARVSSATLCFNSLVHVLRVFLCIFNIKKGIWYVSKRAWIHIWYVSKPIPPCHGTPLMIILNL